MNNQPKQHIDRRASVFMRELLVPIIVSVVVGVASSFLTIYIAVNTLELKFQYLERDFKAILEIAAEQKKYDVRTSRIEYWVQNTEKRIERIEINVDQLKRNQN